MIIRNLPFGELDEKEKRIVALYRNECPLEYRMSNVGLFWEENRNEATEDGTYNGWKDIKW